MSRVGFGDIVVQRRFGDPHHPADLADRVLLLGVELGDKLALSGFQNLRPAAFAPAGTRGIQPSLGALTFQVAFELCCAFRSIVIANSSGS